MMKKYFLNFAIWHGERENLFRKYIEPRNRKYCEMHGLKYIEINQTNFTPQIYFPELHPGDNFHFNRWYLFKDLVDSGKLVDGDVIYQYDADVFIAQLDKFYEPKKSFTYAIDSGNTHCFGFFILKISPFTRKLINLITSREKFYENKDFKIWNEHFNEKRTFYHGDQQAYYVHAGIKPHSWTPFYDLPNNGLHSEVTEKTVLSLDELLENVDILPTEWNVTHLLDETGDKTFTPTKPNTYDIVHADPNNIIYRHFAGGQPWLFEEYNRRYPIK